MHPPSLSPRLVAALAIAVALLRHSNSIHAAFQAMLHTARSALTTTRTALQLCAQTSNDMHVYLHSSAPCSKPPPSPLSRGGGGGGGGRRLQLKQPAPSVPRSVRRLLRLLASDDALSVLRHVAGGAARGLAREMRPCSTGASGSHNALEQLVHCLASPPGQRVVNGAVATAVREGIHTFCQMQQAASPPSSHDWATTLTDAVLSERGQQLVVKLALELTRSVLPIVMHANKQAAAAAGTCTACAQVTPLIKRHLSFSPAAAAAQQQSTAEESPVTRHVLKSVMQAQGRMGVIERLALLAIRDKQLVREVVRTVVAEAVRTYLRTQAELSGAASSGVVLQGGSSPQHVQQSLWKALIQSAVADVKRAVLSRGADASGWLVF